MQKNLSTLFTITCLGFAGIAAAQASAQTSVRTTVQTSVQTSAPKPSAALYAGVSHPDDVLVTTSAEGVTQPVVFEPYAPLHPTLQAREPVMSAAVSDPDAGIVTAVPLADYTSRTVVNPISSNPNDPDAGYVTSVETPRDQLSAGTLIKVVLERPLSTKTTRLGTPFSAVLAEAIRHDGLILIPAGSTVDGRITEIHGGTRLSGSASMHLEPTSITFPDGTHLRVRAQLIDTGLYNSTKVDSEGTIERRARPGETIAVFALATGSGAVAGAVLAGAPGALVGGIVGAGISTVVWLREDRQAELPAGTKLVFSLSTPVLVGAQ